MRTNNFLEKLQERAKEQQKLYKEIPYPIVFQFIGSNLGNHPWMPLIPISVTISFLLYAVFGNGYIELVLKIFKFL